MNAKFHFAMIFWIFRMNVIIPESIPETDLWINTTYQAEDFGIRHNQLPQCEAWNMWWKLQVS